MPANTGKVLSPHSCSNRTFLFYSSLYPPGTLIAKMFDFLHYPPPIVVLLKYFVNFVLQTFQAQTTIN